MPEIAQYRVALWIFGAAAPDAHQSEWFV